MTPKTQSPVQDATDTKDRLIEAGMHEFAERGFRDASIRRICARAGANAAAVNYHFGDKQRFYAEVLVTCHERASARPMPRLEDAPERPAERLEAWVRWFLDRLLVQSRASPLSKLMAREMFDPTPAFDDVIRRSLMPMIGALAEIVTVLLGDDGRQAQAREVQLSVHSILGQCLLYKHAEPAFERLHRLNDLGQVAGPLGGDLTADLDGLARHITHFSLAGMERVRVRLGEDS